MPRSTISIALVLTLVACTADEAPERPTDPPTTPPVEVVESPSEQPSPTPPALPDEPPPIRGGAAVGCVNGWRTPPTDSPRFLQPLGIIRRTTGVRGPLEVVDMRYLEGPESPPAPDRGYLQVVQRWYAKLYARDDLAFQGRFLVESRTFGRGLSAVAPYDTSGFRSPDWIAFQFESGDPELRSYEGLPGTWSGSPYDFVDGGSGGLTFPGLPDDVVGCLDGT